MFHNVTTFKCGVQATVSDHLIWVLPKLSIGMRLGPALSDPARRLRERYRDIALDTARTRPVEAAALSLQPVAEALQGA